MSYYTLNVKPQSVKVNGDQPPQRREVTLYDHHQTWLVNTNEIRHEVNSATARASANTIVYRNENGNFSANQISTLNFVIGTIEPNATPSDSPVSLTANGITLESPAVLAVNAAAQFSNTVLFSADSNITMDGTMVSNGLSTFNGDIFANGLISLSPSSTFEVHGLSTFTADVAINADLNLTGDINQTGNFNLTGDSIISGNLDLGEDLIVRGSLTVLGDESILNVQNLVVEDKNIVINTNDVFNNTFDSGIFIQKGTIQDAGYIKVASNNEAQFKLKPPTGNELTLEMPRGDVTLRLDADFASDQALLTTNDVAFRSLLLDTSFSRHNDTPSVTQTNDLLATGKGFLSSPWIYTNAVESSDNLTSTDTTGIFLGAGTKTRMHQVSLETNGESRLFVNEIGQIGFGTNNPHQVVDVQHSAPVFQISTDNYAQSSTLALTDFSGSFEKNGFYVQFDANTGSTILENTNKSLSSSITISVGGYQENSNIVISTTDTEFNTDLNINGSVHLNDHLNIKDILKTTNTTVIVQKDVDVSGNITTNSDVMLNGTEPFLIIGTQNNIEKMGRSGVHVEEETPVISLSTTNANYRHGSIINFNDAVHQEHWSTGTSNNGSEFSIGRNASAQNTPEFGLDEFFGNTLLRLNNQNQADFNLEATNSTPALIINTRSNGIHLKLGEQTTPNSMPRDTSSYTQNDASSTVMWHGGATSTGDLSYFPNGNVQGSFGNFRFSQGNGTVNTTTPNAKVGADQFYAKTAIGINQTTIDADTNLQVFDTTKTISKFHTTNQTLLLELDDSTDTIKADLRSGAKFSTTLVDETNQNTHQLLETASNHNVKLYTTEGTGSGLTSKFDTTLAEIYTTDNNTAVMNLETAANQLKISTENVVLGSGDNQAVFVDFGKNDVDDVMVFRQMISGSPNGVAAFRNNEIALTVDDVFIVANSGNATLHVKTPTSSTNSRIEFNEPDDTVGMRIEYNPSAQDSHIAAMSSDSNAHLHFYTNGTDERFLIGRNGDFGFNCIYSDIASTDMVRFKAETSVKNKISFEALANSDAWFHFDHDGSDSSRVRRGAVIDGYGRTSRFYLNANNSGVENPNWHSQAAGYGATSNVSKSNLFVAVEGSDGFRLFSTNSSAVTDDLDTAATDEIFFANKDEILMKPDVEILNGFSVKNKIDVGSIITTKVVIDADHTNEIFRMDDNVNRWVWKHSGQTTGVYWNYASGTYSFTNSMASGAENTNNQYVFVKSGTPKAAVDLDTGTFRCSGDLIADGDVIGYSTSDKNFKDNVAVIDGALEKIEKIRGVEFDWNEKQSKYAGHDVGVIAQEVEEVLPEAVRKNSDGVYQVNYEKLVPLLIESIKELKTEIEILKGRG